jgi:alpha-amylase/alpha-mannosidase (GH57 family)
MPEHPLYVAIIWHMHQPFYRDMLTGRISLPWVRMHAAKDYLHMGQALAAHPKVHHTINMVPSLTEQMLAWANGEESDELARLAEQPGWTEDEKRTILNLGFSINWDNIIRRYPRYSELLDRRPAALADPNAFSSQDYLDLLAWFNLAWIDPNWLEQDRLLAGLVAKGQGFTRADLRAIHDKQREIAAGVLPLYRQLAERGQLEIIASPYYHPILPLLIDNSMARRPSPGLPLPNLRFAAPEDAAAQLAMAVDAHTAHFGAPPRGLWPSEGAVSVETVPLIAAAGFSWLASDEVLLGRSLGRPFTRDGNSMITNPRALYQPYRLMAGSEIGPWIIFRDHELADRIGFLYKYLPGRQAAEDMIYRLLEIRRRLDDPANPYLVTIILDGENCWEYYEHNGDVFLDAFYGLLSEREELKPVTVSEYLAEQRPAGTLAKLVTGSWIAGDLTTWIGDPEHNRAWEALARTRAHLAQATVAGMDEQRLATAWRALYAAEGSDWFWWYSHRNRSDQDAIFDELFRHDLAAVYEALSQETPAWLEQPIREALAQPEAQPAAGYITPALTAAPYPGEEWSLAAVVQPSLASTGAMQRSDTHMERLFVGHDQHSLYLRLDLRDRLEKYEVAIYLGCVPGQPVNQRVRGRLPDPDQAAGTPANLALGWEIQHMPGQAAPFLYRAAGHDQWQSVQPLVAALGEKVLEVAVPLATLGLEQGQELCLLATLAQRGTIFAQLPERGMHTVRLQRFERG